MPFLLLLIIWPIIFFLLLALILLPFHFTIYSIINIITVPFQLIKIVFNQKLRSNHALEHATINVLESKYGYFKLAGFAREDGFVVQGNIDPAHLQEASIIGLRQLQGGNHNLAIHKNCGTSMLSANFMAAVAFLALLIITGTFNLLNILLAIIIAHFVGPRTGRFLKKYITTSTKVYYVVITGIKYKNPQAMGLFSFPMRGFQGPREFLVKTSRKKTIEIIN